MHTYIHHWFASIDCAWLNSKNFTRAINCPCYPSPVFTLAPVSVLLTWHSALYIQGCDALLQKTSSPSWSLSVWTLVTTCAIIQPRAVNLLARALGYVIFPLTSPLQRIAGFTLLECFKLWSLPTATIIMQEGSLCTINSHLKKEGCPLIKVVAAYYGGVITLGPSSKSILYSSSLIKVPL